MVIRNMLSFNFEDFGKIPFSFLHVQTLILKYCLNMNEKKKDCGVKIKIIQCEK